jgi:FkbM family methyltransferase
MASGIAGVVKYWRPTIRQDIRAMMRAAVANAALRPVVNAAYAVLPLEQTAAFHSWFWDVFRDGRDGMSGGSWTVSFCGRSIRLPLRPESAGLDWGLSTAILGHDVDIKQTYAALLRGPGRPGLFIDVGSNFGTHSILFVANGIPTISLDPNSACNRYHAALCAANGFEARIETVAIGDRHGYVELSYPPGDPWLGSTDSDTSERLRTEHAVERCRVEQRMLDDYLPEVADRRLLIKIDTEGNESRVLLGGRQMLEQKSPVVIFESWRGQQRTELHEIFKTFGYRIATLPWDGQPASAKTLSAPEFEDQDATNFVAIRLDA